MIKVDSVSKKYSKKAENFALDNFSFEFKKGKITGLLGVNGAGKSTLLKILSLQLFPTNGKVIIDDTEVTEFNYAQLKEKIGFVSETAEFYGEVTVKELLENTLEFYSNRSKFEQIVKECALTEVLSKKIKTLSKGYRQRLSFAIALANDPEILILDEPISGLDPIQINEIRSLIKSIKHDKTVILSTHIMQEITALCDTIIIIHKGKMITSGTEKNICAYANCSNIEQSFLKLTQEDRA